MAGKGRRAPDAVLAQAVGEPVDQRCDAILRRDLADGAQPGWRSGSGSTRSASERDHLDPEAGIDALQHGREQARDGVGAAPGQRQADGEALGAAVEAVEGEFEPPGPAALGLQAAAEPLGDVARGAGEIFRDADRLGEGQPGEPGRRRAAEAERLLGSRQGLVEAGQDRGAEPAGELVARQGGEEADAGKAEASQLGGGLRLQPEGADRQGREQLRLRTGRGDGPPLAVPRQRPGRAGRGGDGAAGGDSLASEAGDEVVQHRRLPAPEVGDAGDVDEESVRRIDRHRGGKAHAPVAKGGERVQVALRIGLGGGELGDQGHGVGGLLADKETQARGRRVHRIEPPHPPFGGDEGEGGFSRRV